VANKRCNACGKLGHIARDCPAKKNTGGDRGRARVRIIELEEDEEEVDACDDIDEYEEQEEVDACDDYEDYEEVTVLAAQVD
jgi:Zinc knuckle